MAVIFSRRDLIKTSALGGSFLMLGCKTLGSQSSLAEEGPLVEVPARVRRRWEPGKDSDFKKQYTQAVEWLKANDQQTFPESDPRSYLTWNRFIDLHNSSCPHGNWLFVPWHRLYLYYFETACQMALQDEGFALPYWDWTLDPVVPDEFFDTASLQANRKIVKGAKIPEEFSGPSVMDRVYSIDDFYSFFSRPTDYIPPFRGPAGAGGSATGAFENNPHNNVHKFIGGNMSNNTSPTDPIFWLHHGNIDRIWHQFQRINPAIKPNKVIRLLRGGSEIASHDDVAEVYLATDLIMHRDGDAEQPTLDWAEKKRSIPSKLKVKDVQDIKTFGYTYDTDSLPPPSVAVKPTPQTPPLFGGLSQKAVVRTANKYGYALIGTSTPKASRLVTSIDVTDEASRTLLSAFAGSKTDHAYFIAGQLVPPKDEIMKDSLILRFFLFVDEGYQSFDFEAENAFKKAEYVGTYSFFGADHVHSGEVAGAGKNTSVEFSKIFRALLNRQDPKTITLVAVAMDMRTRKPLDYFKLSTKSELALEIHSQAKIAVK